MKSKYWIFGWLSITLCSLILITTMVYKIDPYFHYHKPLTDKYFYTIYNQRSQNNGIVKNFDYDAIITGTSMTENFKTSEFDKIFNVSSIKVSYSGGSYKEINDNLSIAIANNPNIKVIVRGLDCSMFINDSEKMREDLGTYPTYLYDDNLFNDVKYIFNKDIIFGRIYTMYKSSIQDDFKPGITSFDNYSVWQSQYTFGPKAVIPDGMTIKKDVTNNHLTPEEINIVKENVTKNVVNLAKNNPNIDFYYFLTPYSVAYWGDMISEGTYTKQIEAEKYVIELILECDNIHLFSFNTLSDITTDLNNYKDTAHYGEWINSLILFWMKNGEYQLTKDNYLDYLDKEFKLYTSFDYNSLNNQIDYEDDYYIANVLYEKYGYQ